MLHAREILSKCSVTWFSLGQKNFTGRLHSDCPEASTDMSGSESSCVCISTLLLKIGSNALWADDIGAVHNCCRKLLEHFKGAAEARERTSPPQTGQQARQIGVRTFAQDVLAMQGAPGAPAQLCKGYRCCSERMLLLDERGAGAACGAGCCSASRDNKPATSAVSFM